MFDFWGNTSSNSTGAWSRHAFMRLFPITQQSHAFSKPPWTSPINVRCAKNVNNVIRFVHKCKSTLYLHLVPVICCNSLNLPHCGTLYWPLYFHTKELPNHFWPQPHRHTLLILHLPNFRTPYSPLTCPKRSIGGLMIWLFEMVAPRFSPIAQNITQIFNTESVSAGLAMNGPQHDPDIETSTSSYNWLQEPMFWFWSQYVAPGSRISGLYLSIKGKELAFYFRSQLLDPTYCIREYSFEQIVLLQCWGSGTKIINTF